MKFLNQRGQLVVEYVLLLFVVVAIATILVKGFVSRDANEPGTIIKAWDTIIKKIGADDAGKWILNITFKIPDKMFMDELKLYEEVKKAFAFEKGKILMVELTSDNVSELKPEILDDLDDFVKRVNLYTINYRPYAVLDQLIHSEPTYQFCGRTFMQVQIISTGEIVDFCSYADRKPITLEDLKKEFKQLNMLLKNKAS